MKNILSPMLHLILWFGIFFTTQIVYTQRNDAEKDTAHTEVEDVKVGLVLSGGGAKGLAHIGALKVIEDAGIRIDYIGGTSMGAIIGSLYASGYNAKDLDSIFRAVNFNTLIKDNLPRKTKTLYERKDSEKYVLNLPFDRFKIGLPKGLSKGQNFFNEFSKFTAHVNNIEDFSKMPIPFFCIATNIANGKEVVLDHGYLPQAVSASGALPSIFSPIEIDGVFLIDGGVSNNFPVKEIKKRGAEIVIGVDVQDSLLSADQLNSVTSIMMQIGNFRTINEMKSKRKETDVYLHPDIKEFSLLSFDKIGEIIESGEKAALDQLKTLQDIKRRQLSARTLTKIEKLSDTIRINGISIEGNQRYTRAYIKGKLKFNDPGKITYQKLYGGINNLSATGNFDRVNHRISKKSWGNEWIVNVKESENTMLLRFALHFDNLYKTAGLTNITKKRLLFNNDVLSLDLILSDNIRYDFTYYIDKGYYWSIGLKHGLDRFIKGIDYNKLRDDFELPDIAVNRIDMDFLDIKTQLYIETLLHQNFSFGVGAEHRRFRLISNTIGQDENQLPRIVFDNNDYGSIFSYLRFDNLDNKFFPTSGFFLNGNLNYYLFHTNNLNADENFVVFKTDFSYAYNLFDKASIRLDLAAGERFGAEKINSFNFFLGGFGAKTATSTVPFYGYDFLGLNGASYAKAGLSFNYEIFRKNHINLAANYANVDRQLYRAGRWFELPKFSGYALGYGLETFAGPLQIKYSFSPEQSEGFWFFSLGFWF